jgi:hypothetical protein
MLPASAHTLFEIALRTTLSRPRRLTLTVSVLDATTTIRLCLTSLRGVRYFSPNRTIGRAPNAKGTAVRRAPAILSLLLS